MESLRHLAHTPTCIAEEYEAMRIFHSDVKQRRKEFIAFAYEFPEVRKFLSLIEKRLGPDASTVIWFRIWFAMQMDHKHGSAATVTALSSIRDFDPASIDYPPADCKKPLSFYIDKLSELIETA